MDNGLNELQEKYNIDLKYIAFGKSGHTFVICKRKASYYGRQ